jgi:hypothetical protein
VIKQMSYLKILGLSILLIWGIGCTKSSSSGGGAATVGPQELDMDLLQPTELDDGRYSNLLDKSPALTFTKATDATDISYEGQVLLSSDASIVKDWSAIDSGGRIEGLSLVDGQQYLARVRAKNSDGEMSSAIGGDGWVVDTTSPEAPTQLSYEVLSHSLIESPAITFTPSSDGAGTGVAKYQVQVLKSADSTVVKGWTDIVSGQKVTGLSLVNNTDYKIQLRALDFAENPSATVLGAVWSTLIDSSDLLAPTAPTSVIDDVYSLNLENSPSITFTGGTDAGSGIRKHQIKLFRADNQAVVKDWSDFVSGNSVSGLSLVSGVTYKAAVRAIDNAGNYSAEGVSDGWLVDVVPPQAPTSIDDGLYGKSLVSWDKLNFVVGTDADGSGIEKHESQVIKASDGSIIEDWTDVANNDVRTGLTLENGERYIVKIRAVDKAGNRSAILTSDGWTVDTIRPTLPVFTGDGTTTQSLTQSPVITFTPATDAASGIARHQAQVVRASNLAVVKSWFDIQSGVSISGLSLTSGVLYRLQLKAIDNAGNESGLVSSDGWMPLTKVVDVTWTANKERAVNQAGGGYKIYYSQIPDFNYATESFVNVPYVSGALAPTEGQITGLTPGIWFIKVVAYSSIEGGGVSSPSAEMTVVIPSE